MSNGERDSQDENREESVQPSQENGEGGPVGEHTAAEARSLPAASEVIADAVFVPRIGVLSLREGEPLSVVTPIEALGLQPRTLNCFTRAGLRRAIDVAALTDGQVLARRNFSPECLADLRKRLRGCDR